MPAGALTSDTALEVQVYDIDVKISEAQVSVEHACFVDADALTI